MWAQAGEIFGGAPHLAAEVEPRLRELGGLVEYARQTIPEPHPFGTQFLGSVP